VVVEVVAAVVAMVAAEVTEVAVMEVTAVDMVVKTVGTVVEDNTTAAVVVDTKADRTVVETDIKQHQLVVMIDDNTAAPTGGQGDMTSPSVTLSTSTSWNY
jgi:hypothetical protein